MQQPTQHKATMHRRAARPSASSGGYIATVLALFTIIFAAPGMASPALANNEGGRESADLILIYKAERTMYLLNDGEVMRTYRVALGRVPEGHKTREGDGRTPEGGYRIDWRNPDSRFHLSLHISYPRPNDRWSAAEAGLSPGGQIMIHGMPNGMNAAQVGHPYADWTNGCIAVDDAEIEEIWDLVNDGTQIVILP